ncbi:MAG: glycolate oxidase subunit GlcF [Candidatus Competibacterales bacterium]
MQTALADDIKDTPEGREADAILRTCVHCGFCLATCPTYLLLGDERDSPRGRIYLMKQVLEGREVSRATQVHLDRCLTCRNCETTCPSGVTYGHLVDIGRKVVEERVTRPWHQRLVRYALRQFLPRRWLFTPALRLGQAVRPLLPGLLKGHVPPRRRALPWPKTVHPRKMLVLQGCVQPAFEPDIHPAAARVLDRLGITLVTAKDGCCGAVNYHLNAHEAGRDQMRRNIDAWWPEVEAGAEAIVMTASGCGAMVKDYGHALGDDPQYAAKAARISDLTRDLAEVLQGEDLSKLAPSRPGSRIAFHPPCTLQHGQKLSGVVERLLRGAGYELTYVPDAHLCCGSAGTYSLLQPALSHQLLDNKLKALQTQGPDLIATANIGCLVHLQGGASVPVRHWVELLDPASRAPGP